MMAARPVRLLLALFLLTITLALMVKPGTSSARAAMGSRTAARTPRVATSTPGNVTYHGGSVMTGTMNVYAIFWEPAGWAVDPNYNGLIMQYYNDVGGSSLYKLMEQYTDANGGAPTSAVLAGTWVDPDDYPGSGNPRPAPTPQQILQEVQTAMQTNGWQAGPSNYFAVYTAEGIVDNNRCGYHSVDSSNTVIFGYILYPVASCLVPNSPNTCQACDSAISTSAHEQFEAATDPSPGGSPGWYYQTYYGEIADLCRYPYDSTIRFGTLRYDNGKANQSWNGHFYLIQEIWDNGVRGGKGDCSQGSQITEYSALTFNSGPWAITAGPDGNLWFTEHFANQVGMITTGGQVTEYLASNLSGVDYGITAGLDGNLWFTAVTATGGAAISKITTSGQITPPYPVAAQQGTTSEITTGPDGNLWFTFTQENMIGTMTTSGQVTEYPLSPSYNIPGSITVGPDGNLWFTEPNTNKIGSITTGGQITEYQVPPAAGSPTEITMGPDRNLWFTTVGGQIIKSTTSGQMTAYPIPTPNSFPHGITAGSDGNLWFTESNVNQIGRITPGGAITECPIPTSSSGPLEITAGPDGNLWFTELGGNNIGKITP